MKKLLEFGLLAFFAISLAGGCSKNDDSLPEDNTLPKYKISVKADKGTDDPLTKALAVEDRDGKHYLVSSWKTTDVIYVLKNYTVIGTLSPTSDGAFANLEGNITATLGVGDKLLFTYNTNTDECDYTGQDGTLETIAQNYDYSIADALVQSIDGENITLDHSLSFTSKQAIVKFILMDKNGNPVYPEKLTLRGWGASDHDVIYQKTENDQRGEIEINIDQTNPHNEIYAAVKMFASAASFAVTGFSGLIGENKYALNYRYTKNTETIFNSGKYYEVKVKLNTDTDPDVNLDDINFNFTFLEDGSNWTQDGRVFVFFEGVTTGYYSIIHDSDGWHNGSFEDLDSNHPTNPAALLVNGKVTAVYLYRQLAEAPSFSYGKWSFGGVEGWKYISANNVPYTVSSSGSTGTVNITSEINLLTPDNTGIEIDPEMANSAKFACNYLVPVGLASISGDGTINEVSPNPGDWITVFQQHYAYAKIIDPEPFVPSIYSSPSTVLHYYALETTLNGNSSYYHLLDDTDARLAIGSDGLSHISAEGGGDWIQVGPGKFVTLRGMNWWTTNLSEDRHSPLPNPWANAELVWTTKNQWQSDRCSYSLSESKFDFNSVLPDPFNWQSGNYMYQIITVCGTKGFVYAECSDITKFIFLPLGNHDNIEFNAMIYPHATLLQYNLNWHYWAKGYDILLFHKRDVTGYADEYWAYNPTSTFFFPSFHDPAGFYPFYHANMYETGRFVPDYALMYSDNMPLHFPARPIKP